MEITDSNLDMLTVDVDKLSIKGTSAYQTSGTLGSGVHCYFQCTVWGLPLWGGVKLNGQHYQSYLKLAK